MMNYDLATLHNFVRGNKTGIPDERELKEVSIFFQDFTGFELIALRELLWMELKRRAAKDFADL